MIFKLYLLILYFCIAEGNFDFPNKSFRKKKHPLNKNEILGLSNVRQVCMDVCEPQYYPSNSYDQYNPYYGNNYPYYSQNAPYYSQNEPYYGQNNDPSYGQYYPSNMQNYYNWCYRNMFRRKYKIDPGNRKPRVFNYRKLQKNALKNKSYDNYSNCKLICYPMIIPEVLPSKSTTKKTTTTESSENEETTKTTRSTKKTTTESLETEETTIKGTTTKGTSVEISTEPTNGTSPSVEISSISTKGPNEITEPTFSPPNKPQGKQKSKRWNEIEKRTLKENLHPLFSK